MDTSRKRLTDKNTCNFCIHYQQIKGSNGKKICKGRCRITGRIKARVDYKCKNHFKEIDEQLIIDNFLKESDKGNLKPYQLNFIEL